VAEFPTSIHSSADNNMVTSQLIVVVVPEYNSVVSESLHCDYIFYYDCHLHYFSLRRCLVLFCCLSASSSSCSISSFSQTIDWPNIEPYISMADIETYISIIIKNHLSLRPVVVIFLFLRFFCYRHFLLVLCVIMIICC